MCVALTVGERKRRVGVPLAVATLVAESVASPASTRPARMRMVRQRSTPRTIRFDMVPPPDELVVQGMRKHVSRSRSAVKALSSRFEQYRNRREGYCDRAHQPGALRAGLLILETKRSSV